MVKLPKASAIGFSAQIVAIVVVSTYQNSPFLIKHYCLSSPGGASLISIPSLIHTIALNSTMENCYRKELVSRRSLKYTYYVIFSGESTEQNPALLFLHGFPDSARLWVDVVTKLHDLTNKIIIPDCLGYGDTNKPHDRNVHLFEDILAEKRCQFCNHYRPRLGQHGCPENVPPQKQAI